MRREAQTGSRGEQLILLREAGSGIMDNELVESYVVERVRDPRKDGEDLAVAELHGFELIVSEEDISDGPSTPPRIPWEDDDAAMASLSDSWEVVERETVLAEPEHIATMLPFTYESSFLSPDLLCWLCEQPATNVVRVNEEMAGGIPPSGKGRLACLSCTAIEFQLDAEALVECGAVALVPTDDPVMARLADLPVQCPFRPAGCQALVKRSDVVQHATGCPHFRYECIYRFNGCKFQCKEPALMQVHVTDCPRQYADLGLPIEVDCKTCLTCRKAVPVADIERGTAGRCSFHPGTWHGYTYAQVRAGTVGILAFRVTAPRLLTCVAVSDGVKTGVVVPLMAAAGGGAVLGVCAAITAAAAAGAVVVVPLVVAGALIMAPVATSKIVTQAALDGAIAVKNTLQSLAEAAADGTAYVMANPEAVRNAMWQHLAYSASVASSLLLTLPALPRATVDAVSAVATTEEIMQFAPFQGCEQWTCCRGLASFAPPCDSRATHTFE